MPEQEPEYVVIASVLDKTGLGEFLKGVQDIQLEQCGKSMLILSTGNTAKLLKEKHGLPVTEVAEYTGVPEGLGGRVKTLDPHVHAGLLKRPGISGDTEFLEKIGAKPIDLLLVNLYDFAGAVTKFEASEKTVEDFAEVIENIDIGGPAMLRSGTKGDPTVIMDPNDYNSVLKEMDGNKGEVTSSSQALLKLSVFEKTTLYDKAIHEFLSKYFGLFTEYQRAKKAIIAGQRAPFKCWTEKH